MSMAQKKKRFSKIIGLIGMLIFLYYAINHYYQLGLSTPSINKQANKWITISGHIDPGLVVKLGASYYTQNPKCKDGFEGEPGPPFFPRVYNYFVTTKPNSHGDYSIQLPLDKYLSGYCQWQVSDINYQVSFADEKKKITPSSDYVFAFQKNGQRLKKNAFVDYQCQNISDVYISCNPTNSNMDLSISPHQKNVTINFVKIKKVWTGMSLEKTMKKNDK